MESPLILQRAYDAALQCLTDQQLTQPDLMVSEPDDDGNVNVEGTLNLLDVVQVALRAAHG